VNPFASVYGCVLVMTYVVCQAPGGPGSRDTDSWLDDIDKNYGPDLPLLLKCTKFGQLMLIKIIEIVAMKCEILG